MKVWTCHDPDGYGEEQLWSLVVAADEFSAEAHWRRSVDYPDPAETRCVVQQANWEWSEVPEPIPPGPGVWWPRERTERGLQYLGYGLWEDGDEQCDECRDHFNPEDMRDVATSTYACRLCRWCAEEAKTSAAAG